MSTKENALSEKEWFEGWLTMQKLLEEQVSPVPVGKAYLFQNEIAEKVIGLVKELAPEGVSSQGQYLDILEQALNTVSKSFNEQSSDPAELADLDLSLNSIEMKLRNTPYQVVFSYQA